MRSTPLESWIARKLQIKEPFTLSQIRSYQFAKLRETLQFAVSQSRFYKEWFQGIDPESIRSLDDLTRLPFTPSNALAQRTNDFLCVSPGEISRIVTLSTSGTTGRPKRIAFTPEDQEHIMDFFHYGMMTIAEPSDRILIFLPGSTEGSVGDLLSRAVSRLGCEGIVYGPIVDYEHAWETLSAAKAACAVGIPTQLLALARHKSGIRLKSVLLSTDYVAHAIADALAEQWGCNVFGHYGTTEMGLGGAVECSARDGYHLREADLLFEIVDPVTGNPAKEGDYGEVVFSTLTRRGMPLIRYRTGDRSRFLTEPCPCGSILPRLERISGRLNDAIALCDGSSISISQLDEILYRNRTVAGYDAELRSEKGCDCLILTVKPAGNAVDSEETAAELRRRYPGLKLDIRTGKPGFFTTGTAKRSILNHLSD